MPKTPAAASTTTSKFILYNFNGLPVDYYAIDEVTPPVPVLTKEVKHHIYVLDVSGSMYDAIAETRTMVEKVMTVEEFSDPDQLVSLFSYASRGDVILHFSRVPVTEVLKPGSKYVEQIRMLRTRGLTCMSQAFASALELIKPGETTAMSVHTDGFFNDPSPMAEMRAIDAIIEKAKAMKGLFVNTIAYKWADYVAMSRISNALSGKCVKAATVKDVYTALHDTQTLLSGRLAPAIFVAKGDADYQVSLNVSQKKINGTATDLAVRGAGADDQLRIWRFRKVSKTVFDKTAGPDASLQQKYAFSRAKLAEGKLNDARFALSSTCNQTLLAKHAKGLTSAQLTAMAVDLESAMFYDFSHQFSTTPGLPNANSLSLIELFGMLNEHTDAFTIDLPMLLDGYTRMGVKKVAGVWSHENIDKPTEADVEASTFVPASLKLVPTDDATMVSTSGFLWNNAEATVNLKITRPAKLVHVKDGQEIKSIAGLKLDGKLQKFNNYTIVSGGDVNVKMLPLRIEKKKLHADLVARGALPAESFNPKQVYALQLEEFPAVPYSQAFSDLPATLVPRMAYRRMFLSICEVLLKLRNQPSVGSDSEIVGTSLTAAQEVELKFHFISPKMYFSAPMRNPYKNRTEAVEKGFVDVRTRYTIELGDRDLLSLSDLPSANEFFGRRFAVKKDGAVNAKPKISDLLEEGAVAEAKPTGRMTLGRVDDLFFDLFEAFAGTKGPDMALRVFELIGVPKAVARKLLTERKDLDALQQAALSVKNLLTVAQEQDYATYVRPLAFYLGSSGLIPDGLGLEICDAEKMKEKFKLKKVAEDKTYFVAGDLVVSLGAENVDVLTESGLALVKRLAPADVVEQED
jgi:hypothetical protein